MTTDVCYLHEDCRASAELGAACLRSSRRTEPTRWREDWLPRLRTARWLEKLATSTGMPFEVRADWSPMAIDWTEFGQTLEEFEERIKIAAARFGRPTEVKSGDHAYGTFGPDLTAKWELPPPAWEPRRCVVVQVRVMNPSGVKVVKGLRSLDAPKATLRKSDTATIERIGKAVGAGLVTPQAIHETKKENER